MSRLKTASFAIVAVLLGIGLFFVAAELVLRLLPVNEGMRAQTVNAANPVFRFESNRTAIYAKGAAFNLVNRVRTNNAGFVSDQDYRADESSPLMALIGDSYVEALMVPYPETMQARLAQAVQGKGRVYAFAASGAGLGQYLAWARHACQVYHPSAMTIVIISNDFSEALYEREHSPGFHAFARRPDGSAELRLTPYQPSLIRSLMRHSALAMYLFSQAKVQTLLSSPLALGADDARFVGNVEASTSEEYLAQSRWAVDRFLDMLPEAACLPSNRIQLVIDGIRPNLYTPGGVEAVKGSYWDQMRTYVVEQAGARGHEVIDMNPIFIERFAKTGKRFEFPTDGHWSGEGHAVVADAVRSSHTFEQVFDKVR